jgi:hypothetical protein
LTTTPICVFFLVPVIKKILQTWLNGASLTRERNHLFSSTHILAGLLPKRARILARLLLKRAPHRVKTPPREHDCMLRRVNEMLKLSMRLRPNLTPQRPVLR